MTTDAFVVGHLSPVDPWRHVFLYIFLQATAKRSVRVLPHNKIKSVLQQCYSTNEHLSPTVSPCVAVLFKRNHHHLDGSPCLVGSLHVRAEY